MSLPHAPRRAGPSTAETLLVQELLPLIWGCAAESCSCHPGVDDVVARV